MITGIGQYFISFDGKVRPICFASFSLAPVTSQSLHYGKKYSTGISAPRSADTINKKWVLTLEPSETSFEVIENLVGSIGVDVDTQAVVAQTKQFDNDSIFYNLNNPELQAEDGDLVVVPGSAGTKTTIVDGRLNIEVNREFYGIIYADGKQAYSIIIKKMRRGSSTSVSIGASTSLQFIVEEPIIQPLSVVDVVLYQLLLAEVPNVYVGGSQITIFGQIVPNVGVTLDFNNLPITINLSFAGQQVITPDLNGFFTVVFSVPINLSFPSDGTFLVSTIDGVLFEKPISAADPGLTFTMSLTGGANQGAIVNVSGIAPPGSIVSLTSTGTGLLFNGIDIQTTLQGTWGTSGITNAPFNTTISVTANTAGFASITNTLTISTNLIFNPVLTYV